MENHKCQMKNQIEIIYVFNIYPNWDLKTRAIISYLRIVVEHFWSQMSFCWRGIKWCQLWKLKYKLWKSKIIIRKSSNLNHDFCPWTKLERMINCKFISACVYLSCQSLSHSSRWQDLSSEHFYKTKVWPFLHLRFLDLQV